MGINMQAVKYILIGALFYSCICFVCLCLEGCATTGTIAPEIVEQSAAVDTSISLLQTQQATSAETAALVSATTDTLEQTAKDIKNDKLSGQVATLKTQVTTLTASLKTEREKTTQIQSDYSTLKVSSGTELVNQSTQINKLTAQLAIYKKWIWRLGITLAVLILFITLYIILRIRGLIPF